MTAEQTASDSHVTSSERRGRMRKVAPSVDCAVKESQAVEGEPVSIVGDVTGADAILCLVNGTYIRGNITDVTQ